MSMEVRSEEMIITSILVALAIAVGAIFLHISCICAETKGYLRGLEEAEQIITEVKNDL